MTRKFSKRFFTKIHLVAQKANPFTPKKTLSILTSRQKSVIIYVQAKPFEKDKIYISYPKGAYYEISLP